MNIVQTHASNKAYEGGKYLELGSCGLCTDMTTRITCENRMGREDYHLLYLVEGTMYFELGGRRVDLGAGNLLLFRPGEPLVYGSYDGESVSYYWSYFSGSCIKDVLEDCGFSEGNHFFIDVDGGICKAFNMIIKENTYGEYCHTTKCNSLFIMLFAEMARLTAHAQKAGGRYEVLLPALRAMEQNYRVWYKNEEYAKMCGISKYHFIHLFTECKGCSPSRYKSELLMQKALELVGISELPMGEIAEMLGFEDALYFSKKFKAHYGVSPSKYRKEVIGGKNNA